MRHLHVDATGAQLLEHLHETLALRRLAAGLLNPAQIVVALIGRARLAGAIRSVSSRTSRTKAGIGCRGRLSMPSLSATDAPVRA